MNNKKEANLVSLEAGIAKSSCLELWSAGDDIDLDLFIRDGEGNEHRIPPQAVYRIVARYLHAKEVERLNRMEPEQYINRTTGNPGPSPFWFAEEQDPV